MTTNRKQKNGPLDGVEKIAIPLAGFCAFGLILGNIEKLLPVLLALLIVPVIWFFWHQMRKRKKSEMLHERLICAIAAHENALISYFHQSRREDLFGNIDDAKWQEKINIFLKNNVVPEIQHFTKWRLTSSGQQAAHIVHAKTVALVEAHRQANPLACVDAATLTPMEYERHCAAILHEAGWVIKMTPATRDGGADFTAEKDQWRMVVQCKRYSQPVGNKAVQEINAAVRLYNGNIACVVAPTGFTRQAQTEAQTLSVHLLHHSSLPAFAQQISEQG